MNVPQTRFQRRVCTGALTVLASLALAGCKPKEISIAHIGSSPTQSSFLGIVRDECLLRFDLNNTNSDKIDHLGFTIMVMDLDAANRAVQEVASQMIGIQTSASKGQGKPYFHSKDVRYSDLPSGEATLSARLPERACTQSFAVELRGFSCRMGENDCAEVVVPKQ